MSEIDNSGLFKTEKWKSSDTTTCIEFKSPINICTYLQLEDYTPTNTPRKRCEHCGATERLISGECAYCRQY